MHGSIIDGFVEVDISISYLDVEAAIGVSADPSFVVDGRPLAAEVRQGQEATLGAFSAIGERVRVHKILLYSRRPLVLRRAKYITRTQT